MGSTPATAGAGAKTGSSPYTNQQYSLSASAKTELAAAYRGSDTARRRIESAVSTLEGIDARKIRDDDALKRQAIAALAELQALMTSDPEAFARWAQNNPERFNEMLRNLVDFQINVGAGNAASDALAASIVSTFMQMLDLPAGEDGKGGRVEYSAIILEAMAPATERAFEDLLSQLDSIGFDLEAYRDSGAIYNPSLPGDLGDKWAELKSFALRAESRGVSTELPPDDNPFLVQYSPTNKGFSLAIGNITSNGTTNNGRTSNTGDNTMASNVNNNGGVSNFGQTSIPSGVGEDGMSTRARMLTILANLLHAAETSLEDQVEALEQKPEVSNLEMFQLQDLQGKIATIEELLKGFIKDGNETTVGVARDVFTA